MGSNPINLYKVSAKIQFRPVSIVREMFQMFQSEFYMSEGNIDFRSLNVEETFSLSRDCYGAAVR